MSWHTALKCDFNTWETEAEGSEICSRPGYIIKPPFQPITCLNGITK